MATDLTPIETLDKTILSLCTRINAATCELLELIREFDERGGCLKWGLENTATWLAWRCDLSMATAREKVRVARALKQLPLISAAFSAGELSYSKVRSLTRVAGPGKEEDLLAFALRNTAGHVAGYCRELRMGNASSTDIAERAFAERSLRLCRDADRGRMSVSIELPLETGELLEKALDKARDDACLQIPDLVDTSWSTRQADAFVTMLREYLGSDEDAKKSHSSSEHFLVNVHVDQSALAAGVGRSSLPIETVKRLCCDGQAVVLTETAEGEPLSIGRKSRVVPQGIARAVRDRDKNRCRFPGCRNRRFVDIHHIAHWADGGATSLDNTLLLCTKHHTLVHEGRFRIDRDFRDQWTFFRPDGIAVPECGYHARDMLDDDSGERYENPPRGGLLSAVEKLVNEPPPPDYRH
ncbi:MAG: HNH endonuclease [Gammaproteobacteria bacterium]|nr:HNH endonuclease [Gammaproteobacteria bacterium]